MPRRLTGKEWEQFARGRHVCVLGTIGEKGEPVLTPIWYLYREGHLYMRTGKDSAKARHIGRDPRVTVCVQDERPPYKSATVYGKATIEPEEAGLGAKISRHYLGAIGGMGYMRAAAETIQQSAEITIVVTPDRVLTQDFSPETPWYGRLWLLAKRVLPPGL